MIRILLSAILSVILILMNIEAEDSNFYTKQNIKQSGNQKRIESVENMIKIFYGKPLYIFVPNIRNRTSSQKLPSDISIMVRNTFNSIGNSVLIMSYLDTKNLPKDRVFIINGAITTFDLRGASSEDGLQASGKGSRGGESATISVKDNLSTKITQLGITFNPSDAKTGLFITRTSTSNIIDVRDMSDDDSSEYSLLGVSINLEDKTTSSDGVHNSLRELVEINTIEVLGRLTHYPYWLLTDTEVNDDMVQYLSNAFIRDSLKDKLKKISYLLSRKDGSLKVNSVIDNKLRSAIINYKKANGLAPNDIISRKLYISLLSSP